MGQSSRRLGIALFAMCGALLSWRVHAADPARGAALYAARCGGCHSLDEHVAGPRHRGVLGRRAGSLTGSTCSDALARSRVIWTPENLDRWLEGPTALVPGNRMAVRLASRAEDRARSVAGMVALASVAETFERVMHDRTILS